MGMTNEQAIKEINFITNTLSYRNTISMEAVEMAVEALEQTRWIPVTERLPKLYEKVLVTVNTEVSIGWREEDGWRIVDYISLEKYADSWIRLWMPLPEPYKAESEDKE